MSEFISLIIEVSLVELGLPLSGVPFPVGGWFFTLGELAQSVIILGAGFHFFRKLGGRR